jgi:hypothetical protein
MKLTSALLALGAVGLGGCRSDMTSGRFEKADRDNNGLVTQAEAGLYVADDLFEGLDNDKNKRISSAEWNAGGNHLTVQSFRKADQNGDGTLTEDELKQAAMRSKQMNEFISKADLNHDGGVSKQEALAFYASKEGPMR